MVWSHSTNARDRITKGMYKWKPIAARSSGRPKNRWEDDIMNNIKRLKINNWISEVQNRTQSKSFVEKAKAFTQ
ncbi:hypothetical protein C0J52_01430 [Blattella germanica]|nr:hypothetical protein C0J52_01430 [Blattella germanica]PSN56217.1 hypothetical protein C0J52_01430 [Blattella germanica]PSN56218.1 hypothetical protein C0J52_01430 [Blattella germanica]